MATHIHVTKGRKVAPKILLPGDPLRAKFIAENFLEDAQCYNDVRGMFGFTGTYKGEPVSVQGTGMGLPSLSIYVHELINEFKVEQLIRVGSCGAFQENIKLRDIILAQGACTNSSLIKQYFGHNSYSPLADFELLNKAHIKCQDSGVNYHVGNILSSDYFYDTPMEQSQVWKDFQVLAVEMETAALYTLAAKFQKKALSVLTVSDHIFTGEQTTPMEREQTFGEMVKIALAI